MTSFKTVISKRLRMISIPGRRSWIGMIAAMMVTTVPMAPATSQGKTAQASSSVAVYTIRKGDTLYDLSARYLVRMADIGTVQRINRIADPHRILTGSRLQVPWTLLRKEQISARIRTFSGAVRIAAAGRTLAAAPGLALGENTEIETGANAFITLDLPDGTAVAIPSQSRVKIARMRRTLLTGSVERRFDILAGRARAIVTPVSDPNSDFRVSTPAAVSAVRGTEFRVSYDPAANRALTEVVDGKVAVSFAKVARPLLVQAGFGTSSLDAPGTAAAALLPAPGIVDPGATQRNPELAFTLKPVASATGYRVQIARDAGFLDTLAEEQFPATDAIMPAIPNGTYFVRISAVDGRGLEGLTDTYSFDRRLNTIEGSMEQSDDGGRRQYLFRWNSEGDGSRQFRFQLSQCDAPDLPLIDRSGLTTKSVIVSDLPGGEYCWRVMALQFLDGKVDTVWLPTQKFRIAGK